MVKNRIVLALLLSLGISAIFTFWLSRSFFKSKGAAVQNQHYVGAAQSLEAGQLLAAANLKLVDWPATMALEGAFAKPEEVAGRTLLYPLSAGQPILARDLSSAGVGSGLSTKIPDGMRAISLRSDQVVGVAGFLQPGTRIDVLVTYHATGTPEAVTSTVLQDAQIIAAGQKIQPDPEGKPTTSDVVTLLVNPSEAERVVLAAAQGTVHFVLRNGQDHQHRSDAPAQLSELAGGMAPVKTAFAPGPVAVGGTRKSTAAAAPAAATAAKPYTVQTISGTKQSVESFQ